MATCKYCGKELAEGEKCTCPQSAEAELDAQAYFKLSINKDTLSKAKKGLSTLKDTVAGIGTGDAFSAKAVDGAFEDGLNIVDQCVVPTEQEIPVRQYDIARLYTPLWKRAFGRLQVTNKRILFRATGKSLAGPVVMEKEFSMEEIGGIEIKTDHRFCLLVFLLTFLGSMLLSAAYTLLFAWIAKLVDWKPALPVIMTILTMAGTLAFCFLVKNRRFWKATLCAFSAFACCILGSLLHAGSAWNVFCGVFVGVYIVLWVFTAMVDDLQIVVKIKGGHDAVEISRKLARDERSGFKIVQAWTDTDVAVRELGALIDDVKRFGDAGIAKWKA